MNKYFMSKAMFPPSILMLKSHLLELGAKGEIQSEKISIGGPLSDDGKYIL